MKMEKIFLLLFAFCMVCNAKELRFVQAIWRHGDRAPSKHPYPNDPYDESYWPTGWSQLTELGVQQLEELGSFFRKRYVGSFVNETFNVYQIYVQSSDSDRALSSAQAFLDGMFNLNVCDGPRKAPIPIHSTGVDIDDFLLKPTSTDCPAYEKHFERLSALLLKTTQQNYDILFSFLGNVTGIGFNITVDQVGGLSNIAREITHNLTQPDWVQKIWPEYGNATTLDLIKIIDRETRINEFNDDKLAKYRGGFLLGDWLSRAKNVAKKKQKEPSKMVLYSSHDGTLLSLLYSLKIADGEQIPYAAAVIFEIYETDVGKFEAQFLYRKNGELLMKTIPGCVESCPVDQLLQILNDNAVYSRKEAEKNWNKIFRSSCTKLSAGAETASVEQVIQRLIKGFKSYHEYYLSEITRLQELLTSLTVAVAVDGKDEASNAQTNQNNVCQTDIDQKIEKESVSQDFEAEIGLVKNELALAEENKELFDTRSKLVESLLQKYEEHQAKFGSKPNKSESLGDLRPIGHKNRTIQGNSTITLKYKANLDHNRTISGLTYQSPLINHRAKIFEKKRADQAMAEIHMEMLGMLGKISIELKAIVGFARITTGDTFEVVIKHDGQKWKSRGKTLQDRTQNWEQTHTLMNIMADSPIFIKVFEIKLFRNHLLSERTFEPSDFFNAQPQLVTMNLHPLGTIKLQLVVTWIPFLSLKSDIRTLGNSQSASLLRNHSKVRDSALLHSVSMGAQPNQPLSSALTGNFNGESCVASKVVLRQKKRQRQMSSLKDLEKDNRRSSTVILDNMYREFSKSIPTIDDLTGLKTLSNSKQNLHKSGASESHINPPLRNNANLLKPASWSKSISMTHLVEIDDSKLIVEKKAASLHKKDRTRFLSSKKSAESDDSSDTSSQIASVVRSAAGLKKIDALLEYVDKLRVYLGTMRSSEYTELTAFEACMLNWEAVLKLNRATMLEDQRTAQKGSQRRSASSNNKKIEKRSSMYNQHSPSNISDELDDNVLMNSNDQVSENDSGIDSLRQHISPYNSKIIYQQQKHHQHMQQNHHPIPIPQNLQQLNYGTTGRTGSGPAQRRFKQFKERRKSLGVVLDSMTTADYERIVLNSDKFWEPQANVAVSPHTVAMASALGAEFTQTASGNAEVDNCLKHHLKRAIVTLATLQKIEGPLEYRLTEMLCRMEQDTVALEELLNISDTLPALPNITNLLADLGANSELQEIWLSTSYPLNSFVMVPTEHLQRQIKKYLLPIVQIRYPRLVNPVLENVMNLLVKNGDWEPDQISLFQFVGLFRGKHLTPFIENLAHESWITSSLKSTTPNVVKEVMDRLRNVPVVPPLESLRHIGLCLLRENKEITAAIDSYLRTARAELANDLTACFVCLLEHKDNASRQGACRALTILQQESVIDALQYVASEDENKTVREAAKEALDSLGCICHDYEEVTKV